MQMKTGTSLRHTVHVHKAHLIGKISQKLKGVKGCQGELPVDLRFKIWHIRAKTASVQQTRTVKLTYTRYLNKR